MINFQKRGSLEINYIFIRKIAITKASKYVNFVKVFSKNHTRYERKLFKEQLFAYHKDKKKIYFCVHFKLYGFE